MNGQGPDSEAVSAWLGAIFKAPENRGKLKIKDVAAVFGQRFNRRSPATLISKVIKGEREIKLEELVFFEELFGLNFPPPWGLRHGTENIPTPADIAASAVYGSFSEDHAIWAESTRPTLTPPIGVQQARHYRITVSDAAAFPSYRPGNTIWVDPWRIPKATDDVYVELIDPKSREKITPGIIRECVKAEADSFVFALWSPGTEERYDRRNLALVHPIVSVTR